MRRQSAHGSSVAAIANFLRRPVRIVKLAPDKSGFLGERDLAIDFQGLDDIRRVFQSEGLQKPADGGAQWSRITGKGRHDSEGRRMGSPHQCPAEMEER